MNGLIDIFMKSKEFYDDVITDFLFLYLYNNDKCTGHSIYQYLK